MPKKLIPLLISMNKYNEFLNVRQIINKYCIY